jgi:hypothetical protein
MTFKPTHLLISLIAGMLLGIFLFKSCGRGTEVVTPKIDTTSTKTITIDSSRVDTFYKPKYVYLTPPKSYPPKVDTVAILKDYYSVYFYEDTIYNNDSLRLIISDTITENQIYNRHINFKATCKTITITNNITKTVPEDPKSKLYLGGSLVTNSSVLGNLEYIPKKDKYMYGVGVGINKDIQPVLQFKLMYKIK